MTGLTLAPIGHHAGVAGARALAAYAENLGYDSFWVAEAAALEAFVTLTAAADTTDHLALGTGVVPLQLRTPPLLAMAAASLLEAAPDRTVSVGVGVSSPGIVRGWHSAEYSTRPLAQVREFVTLLRACLSGEKVRFAGEFYDVDGFRLGRPPDPARVRIVLAALNPGMLRLAGEIGDGVLLNHVPLDQVPSAVERVRDGGDAVVHAYVHAGVGDPTVTLDQARTEIYPYLRARGYAAVFTRAGFGSVVEETARKGRAAHIPAELVARLETVGTPADVVAAIDRHVKAGVDHPILFPLPYGPDPETAVRAAMRAAAERHDS